MKISVIGAGKTGSKVVEMLGDSLDQVFDGSNLPTVEKLRKSDAVIIFIPGDAVSEILDIVVESGIPAAWGSTGYNWPEDLNQRIIDTDSKWVIATNFSLGMNVIRKCIQAISTSSGILKNPVFKIHEVHHVHKKDAPSGTALTWKEWLGKEAEVTSVREGDVNGIHELRVTTATEELSLKHEALDRSLFAEGAIWAAEQLVNNQTLVNGIYTFDALFDKVTQEIK